MKIEDLKFRAKTKVETLVSHDRRHDTPVKVGTWVVATHISGGRYVDLSEFWALIESGILDPSTLEMWTGLHDNNGIDIYEGDIIIFDSTIIGGERIQGEVMFNRDQTLGDLAWGLWDNGYMRTDFLGDIEIIGNIHDRKIK